MHKQAFAKDFDETIPTSLLRSYNGSVIAGGSELAEEKESHLWRTIVQDPMMGEEEEGYEKRWEAFTSKLLEFCKLLQIPSDHRVNIFAGNKAAEMVR